MKNSNKIFLSATLIVMSVFIILPLVSCKSNDPQSKHRIAMMGLPDDDVFNGSVQSLDYIGKDYIDNNAEPVKNFSLANGDVRELLYEKSVKGDTRDVKVYTSEDENISCRYHADTGKLYQIFTINNVIELPRNITTEAEFRAWTEQLLAGYGVNDLSAYRFEMETLVRVSNENSTYGDRYPGLYTDLKSNETLSMLSCTYTKYVGNYKTTDMIEIYAYYRDENSVLIRFDENKLSGISEVAFDNRSIEEGIDAYFKSSIKDESYKYKSFSVNEKKLSVIDGKLCLIYTTEVTMIFKYDNLPVTMLVTLVVFPDGNIEASASASLD